jgi:hypothetical protein
MEEAQSGGVMTYQVMITEVTLYGKLRCVAGYDLNLDRMVRPEPAAASFWDAVVCGENTTFHPGHIVEFTGNVPATAPPHQTEDVVVTNRPRKVAVMTPADFRAILESTEKFSAGSVFGDCLIIEGVRAYVPAGAACGSLACMVLLAKNLHFHAEEYDGRRTLRATLPVGGQTVQLSVAAKALKQPFLNHGLQAPIDLLKGAKRLHVRLGLARPFGAIPDKCYLQVNGIYPI